MEKQIKNLLNSHYVNIQAKKVLKKDYALNIYHLKILKYIYDNKNRAEFTTSEFKEVLSINQTMLTHVISYLHNLNYYKKERSKLDERKVLIMVETRHKTKIIQLIHNVEKSLHKELNITDFNIKENNLIDYIVRLNACIGLMHNSISNKYNINIDHFMVLLFIQQSKHRTCTLKDIKNKFGWDLVKINKSIKTLVQLKYVSKKRDEYDERVVLVNIYKNVELEVNNIIEEVLTEYMNNYGEQNLAMLK